jgi:hypothetical protein
LPSQLEELVVYRKDYEGAESNFTTIKKLPKLRTLEINFDEHTYQNDGEAIADLSSLPQLQTVTLGSGSIDFDRNSGSINPFFCGHTDTVHTLIVEGGGQGQNTSFKGDDGRNGLQTLFGPFQNIRRLVLWDLKCSDTLERVKLPQLETLETQWCSYGLIRGMILPNLQNLSASIAMYLPPYSPILEIGAFLRQLKKVVLRLEYSVFEIAAANHTPLQIEDIYQRLTEARQKSLQTCLVEGHVEAPPENHEWLKFLPRIEPNIANLSNTDRMRLECKFERQQKKKRRKLLRRLKIDDFFRMSVDQEGILKSESRGWLH